MKKYLNIYSDRQDYNSESRPTDGSVASKIGPAMQYDGVNVEVLDPEVGDAVYHDKELCKSRSFKKVMPKAVTGDDLIDKIKKSRLLLLG